MIFITIFVNVIIFNVTHFLVDVGYGNVEDLLRLAVQLGFIKPLLPDALLYRDTAIDPDLVSHFLLQFYNNGSALSVNTVSKFASQVCQLNYLP